MHSMIPQAIPYSSARRYILPVMNRLIPFAIAFSIGLAGLGSPHAQTADDVRASNALRDMARAQERQADELRRLRQIEGDRARREDRASRAADALSRSSRRFDRH